MALLTIVDAVRLTGVSRAQLYRYLKAGRLSRTPEGFLDTAERFCRKVAFLTPNQKITCRKINGLRVPTFLFSVICDRTVILAQPVSSPLQGDLRFFPPLYPHRLWSALRLSYLSRRSDTGLPRSTRLTRMGEVLSVRRERWTSMTGYYQDPVPATVPFWLKPGSIFGLVLITTFIAG
jgi:hypothetical protein